MQILDDTTRAKIDEIKDKWSSQGRRVILLARKTILKENIRNLATSSQFEDEVMHHARDDLILVGIVGIVDPPRDEIPSVVSILRGAGIRIFMVCYSIFYVSEVRLYAKLPQFSKTKRWNSTFNNKTDPHSGNR